MTQMVQELMATPLGQALSSAEAHELADNAKDRSVNRGACLFRLGDRGDSLFVILAGMFDVVLGQPGRKETVVAHLGPGQIVGEMEVMTGTLRVASLRATDEGRVLELSQARLDTMLEENRPAATKVLRFMAKALARRLAAVNQRILDKTPTEAPPAEVPPPEPVDVVDEDLILVDDEDLDVLDKLWS